MNNGIGQLVKSRNDTIPEEPTLSWDGIDSNAPSPQMNDQQNI